MKNLKYISLLLYLFFVLQGAYSSTICQNNSSVYSVDGLCCAVLSDVTAANHFSPWDDNEKKYRFVSLGHERVQRPSFSYDRCFVAEPLLQRYAAITFFYSDVSPPACV